MATLSIEQAAALLKHRCEIICFDGVISDMQLFSGSPAACLPILRYLFINFSAALSEFFHDAGHIFVESMSDEELVTGIIRVWPWLSPYSPIGPITVTKMLQRGQWGRDRLIFTLQSISVCYHQHKALDSRADEDFMTSSGFNWSSTTPRQQFGPNHQELVGTESERERSLKLQRQTEVIIAATLMRCRQAAEKDTSTPAHELESILEAALKHVRRSIEGTASSTSVEDFIQDKI